MIHRHDLKTEQHSAAQQDPVARPKHRHQNNVHRRQEARLCGGGVDGDADLLGRAGRKQKGAADQARDQKRFALGVGGGPAEGNALLAVHGVKRPHRGQQHDHGQPAPPGQKRIGSHAGTRALGHESRAPDKGAEHQHQRMFGLGIHQPIPSTLSRP